MATSMFTPFLRPTAHYVPSPKGPLLCTLQLLVSWVTWGEGIMCDEGDKGSEGILRARAPFKDLHLEPGDPAALHDKRF